MSSARFPSRVVVAHNQVEAGDDAATADVLEQVDLVLGGLAELGIPASAMAVPGWRPQDVLAPEPGLLVFNLIESPAGAPHLCSAATGILERMGLPFTGSPAAQIWLTTDKIATRQVLSAAGVPVAPGGRLDPLRPEVLDRVPPPWIVKPGCEDASLGIDKNPVCADREVVLARAADLARRFPDEPVLVESYLPGREFNIAVLEIDGEPVVLPIPEMMFVGYPAGMPRIMDYEAKWTEGTFSFEHTSRRYIDEAAEPHEAPLLARLREVVLAAWQVTGISGYSRVDLRLDADGEPCVLEVNANPCIAPESGMVAAAEKIGFGMTGLVEHIVTAAWQRALGNGRARRVATLGRPALAPVASFPVTPRPRRARGGPRRRPAADLAIRDGIERADRPAVARLLSATGFFNEEEMRVALELVDTRLAEGPGCHYRFLVAEAGARAGGGKVAGYACWGPIDGTRGAADLYWIAVAPAFQRRGVGAALLAASEERMGNAGRERIYVETSTRPQYEPTRGFYLANGYRLEAELPDYYAPGDGKAIFVKVMPAVSAAGSADADGEELEEAIG